MRHLKPILMFTTKPLHLVAVEPAKQLRLVILDACRDNPFAKTMKRTIGSRAIGRGLAKVEPSSPNTMIAFAAKAGSTASDGDGKNSPFALALVDHLAKPGLDLRKAFGFVRDDVLKATSNTQEPFVYGSLGGNDVTLVPAAPAAAASVDQDATMRRDYEFALQIATKPVWDSFINKYPSGFYTDLAKAQRDKLAAEATRIEATNKAKAAQEEQARLAIEGAKAAEAAKAAADIKIAPEQRAVDDKVATLTPPADKSDQRTMVDLPRSLQSELRRVGCHTGSIDSNWNAAAQRSLDLFNKHAGMKLDVKLASVDALDAVKSKSTRICPLICDHGFKADGDLCTKITCRSGYEVGDENTCEKIEVRKPTAKREEPQPKREHPVRSNAAAELSKPQALGTGQIICNNQGCRPVAKGCRLGPVKNNYGMSPPGEVCN